MQAGLDSGGSTPPRPSTVRRVVAWVLSGGLLGLILIVLQLMQGPQTVASFHEWTCGRSSFWKGLAERLGDCATYIQKQPATSLILPSAAAPRGFEKAIALPSTYPGEFWRSANGDDLSWLVGEWCYSATHRFLIRISAGKVIRESDGTNGERFIRTYSAFVSSNGVFRLRDDEGKLPGIFINYSGQRDANVLHEFGRSVADDGTVKAGKRYQALRCKQ